MPETTPSSRPAEAYLPATTPAGTLEPPRDARVTPAIKGPTSIAEASRLLLEGHKLLLESHTEEAAPLLLRALEVYERQQDIPAECVQVLGDLAAIATSRGDFAAAESLLQRALGLAHVRLGVDHPDVATILGGLARLYLRRSEFTKAEPMLQRLLEIKRARGEEHPEVATVLASLATVHSALGAHESAESILRRVLAIREKTLAPNHFATMTTLEHLAESCAARGKVDEALTLLHRALAMRDRTLGPSHSSMMAARTRIADLELLRSNEELSSVPMLAPMIASPPPQLEVESENVVDAPTPVPPERVIIAERPHPTTRDELYDALYDEWDELEERRREQSFLDRITAKAAPITAFARTPRGRMTVVAVGVTSLVAALVLAKRTRADVVSAPSEVAAAARGATVTSARPERNVELKTGSTVPPSATLVSAPAAAQVHATRRSSPATATDRRPPRSVSRDEGAEEQSTTIPLPNAPRLRGLETPLANAPVTPVPGAVVTLDFAPVREARSAAVANAPTPSGADFVHAVLPAGNPAPEYPPDLLRRRIEGRVVAEFLVDAKGRVDARTFRVISSSDEQFTQAVRDLLPSLRFLPAESAGVKTEEWVAMPFRFSLKAQ